MIANKKLIRLVVVDDTATRKADYGKFVNALNDAQKTEHAIFPGYEFKFEFCSKVHEAQAALNKRGLLVCMRDVMLTPTWTTDEARKVDGIIIEKSIPLVLVSAWFGSTDAHSHLYSLTSGLKRFPPLMPWPDIERVGNGSPVKDTIGAFRLFLGDVLSADPSFEPQPNETISLLHITDLHCGTAKFFAGEAFGIKTAIGDCPSPNFLAITGDISNRGAPIEFDECLAIVNDMLKHEVLAGDISLPTNRVLMTPGNHDLDWSLALSPFVEATLNDKKEVTGFEVKRYDLPASIPKKGIQLSEMGLRPLTDFMALISGAHAMKVFEEGIRYVPDFAMAGVHFVELNVEAFDVPPDYSPLVPLSNYKRSIKSASSALASVPAGDCVVFLVHRLLPVGDDRHQQFHELVQNVAKRHPVIVLCGHIHENRIEYDSELKALCVGGMCLGTHRNVGAGERPSFRHLALSRNDGFVTGVKVTLFEKPPHETWACHKVSVFRSEIVRDGDYSWTRI
jgi:hypothetical protein